jgi:hypothetical protein
MSDLRLTSCASNCRFSFEQASSHRHLQMFKKNSFLILLACLDFLAPMGMYGQSAASYGEARVACAQGLGRQAVDSARAQGFQRGLADLCVLALSSTASSGKLLDMYRGQTGEEGARLLVNQFTDRARLSTVPFRSSSTPQEMWNKGELTPSLAFDAGFTRSFLDKTKTPPGSIDMAELKRKTEECLSQTQSLAVCADLGGIQGALAYQTSNAFSGSGVTPSPKTAPQGPDKAQTAAAIDRKFQIWAQSWSWDRYQPGSVQITSMDCTEQCKASGRFSFNRLGAIHTIPFVAFLPSVGDGKYSLGRLCYNDDTNGMRECTD